MEEGKWKRVSGKMEREDKEKAKVQGSKWKREVDVRKGQKEREEKIKEGMG